MIEIEVKDRTFKIKEFLSVKTKSAYVRKVSAIQRYIKDKIKESEYKDENLEDVLARITDARDLETIEKVGLDPDYMLEIEMDQFKILYNGFVLDPKLTDSEIEEMDSAIFDVLKEYLLGHLNELASKAESIELKKKHVNP